MNHGQSALRDLSNLPKGILHRSNPLRGHSGQPQAETALPVLPKGIPSRNEAKVTELNNYLPAQGCAWRRQTFREDEDEKNADCGSSGISGDFPARLGRERSRGPG